MCLDPDIPVNAAPVGIQTIQIRSAAMIGRSWFSAEALGSGIDTVGLD
ncbi:MAG: hypothetical protein HC929_08960 [Leptolyngbyaceae cyanobacterium SM2_5_2]|nr:hypothetical protein [Leptolyngbyaceae cyanobacterium SM2_5_2]